jgi:acetyl esterase/lipase
MRRHDWPRSWPAWMLAVTLLLVACAPPLGRAPASSDSFRLVAEDVPYAAGHSLDVYMPHPEAGRPPVVVMLHACCGDRSDLGKLAEGVAAAGAAVFNADWAGLDGDAHWPSAYAGAACAVRYARAAAVSYRADPSRITLLGWSDGALVASVIALAGDRLRRDLCLAPDRTAVPGAFVAVGGFFGWTLPVPARYVTPRAVRFLGGTPEDAGAAWRAAMPYRWLGTGGSVDVRLLVGSTDPLVADARRFHAALRASAWRARLVVIPPGGDQTLISPRSADGQRTIRETLDAAWTAG